jgi:TPR repeat protein
MEFILTVKKQASLGDASAQFTLGWSYEHGTSVPQNYELAFEW